MEINEMTPEKSLLIMSEIIGKSRRDLMKDSGRPLIVWGMLVCVTSLAVWILWKNTGNPVWNWLWFVMAAIGFSWEFLSEKREGAKPKTFLGESIGYLWLTFGIFSICYAVAAMFLAPLPITAGIVLMLGLCISLTGTMIKQTVLSAVGLPAGVGGAIACSLMRCNEDVTLVMTGMSVLLVLTGVVMNIRYRRICSRN